MFDEDSPRDLLDEIKPDVLYTKGADYTMETLPEADIMKRNKHTRRIYNFLLKVNLQPILLIK